MKCNLAAWDRVLRFIFGFVLLAYLVAGGPFWALVGMFLLLTAGWGICPIYGFFRFRTLRDKSRFDNRPRKKLP